MKKKICLAIVSLLVMSLIMGCAGTQDLGGSRWEIKELKTQEQTFTGDLVKQVTGEIEIVFVDDTKFFIGNGDDSYEGSYTQDGKELTMTVNGVVQKATVNGSELVLYGVEGTDTEMTMKRK